MDRHLEWQISSRMEVFSEVMIPMPYGHRSHSMYYDLYSHMVITHNFWEDNYIVSCCVASPPIPLIELQHPSQSVRPPVFGFSPPPFLLSLFPLSSSPLLRRHRRIMQITELLSPLFAAQSNRSEGKQGERCNPHRRGTNEGCPQMWHMCVLRQQKFRSDR